jgi:hypothetical protein
LARQPWRHVETVMVCFKGSERRERSNHRKDNPVCNVVLNPLRSGRSADADSAAPTGQVIVHAHQARVRSKCQAHVRVRQWSPLRLAGGLLRLAARGKSLQIVRRTTHLICRWFAHTLAWRSPYRFREAHAVLQALHFRLRLLLRKDPNHDQTRSHACKSYSC